MYKLITFLVFSLIPLQAIPSDRDLFTHRIAEILFEMMELEYNRHIIPRSPPGIIYEAVDSNISRTHCPIVRQISIYNKHGRKRDYLVRDCRR